MRTPRAKFCDYPTREEWEAASARERLVYLRTACDAFILTTEEQAGTMSHGEACAFINEDSAHVHRNERLGFLRAIRMLMGNP